MRCGYDCDCPSRLYHDLDYLKRRYEAPIPPPSAAEMYREIVAMLAQADEDAMETEVIPVDPMSDRESPEAFGKVWYNGGWR